MTISGLLLTVAGALVIGLVTFGFVLNALDKILDSRDRDAIRARVRSFWFRTAALEVHEQFQLALRSRYAQMRRLQWTFLKLFLWIALALSVYGALKGAILSPAEIKETEKNNIHANLDYRYSYYFQIDDDESEPEFGDSNGRCTIGSGFADMRAISGLAEIKAAYMKFLDDNERNSIAMRLFSTFTSALPALIMAIPLALGLILSFNVTLWLLSRLMQSNLGAFLIVAADILVALAMPTIVSSVLLTCLAFAVVFSFDVVPDYTMFTHPTWATLAFSSVCFTVGMSLSWPVVVALFAKTFPFEMIGSWYVISSTALYALDNVKTMFVDLGRIAKFDFSIGLAETLINYAIGIDLLFSLIYIVPCLSLVLMQRNEFTRKLFLNVVQWIAEHPKGPLIALEEMITSFAKYLVGVAKR